MINKKIFLHKTWSLTAGADNRTGTTADDLFDASTSATFSAFDKLDGGTGTDTLNALIASAALPSGVTVKGIEIANINTTGGGLSLADVSGWTGLTDINLSVGAAGAATVTAATTTNVGLNFISGSSTLDGGKNITIAATTLGNAETITVGGTTKAVGDVTIAAISATGAGYRYYSC